MATQADQSNNPVAVIRQNLTAMAPEFKAALPSHVSVEKFSRVAMTAIQNEPKLVDADRRSLFGAFVRLAQDGLLPDGREAAVVMFGNKAQAMPMIAGVLKKIRQSGEVAKVSAQVVYANDTFVVRYGFDEDVEHVPPALNETRGDPIGAYATAILKDGSKLLEVMSLEEIEKVRNVSRAAKNGPWVAWWGEMARKTVMRRLSKRLPMSTDLEEDVFARDETLSVSATDLRRIEQQPDPSPPTNRLDAIEMQIGETIEHDAGTGEIMDGELVDDAPHPASALADRLIGAAQGASSITDVDQLEKDSANDVAAMPDEIGSVVKGAFDTARARLAKVAA